MSNEPLKVPPDLVDPADIRDARSRDERLETQSRSWSLAANAGALLLCFNGLLDHKICSWAVFQPIVIAFVVGTFATFASLMTDSLISRIHGNRMQVFEQSSWFARRIRETNADLERAKKLPAAEREPAMAKIAERSKIHIAGLDELDAVINHLPPASAMIALSVVPGIFHLIGIASFAFGVLSALLDPRYASAVCPV